MVVVSPSGGQQLLPFSPVTHQRLHQSAARPGADPAAGDQVPGAPFGQPLPGGRLAWAVNGAALEVLCCRTGARRAAWTFGAHRPDAPPPQVTAVCSISEAVGPAAAHLLAVGLDCGGRSETAGSAAGSGGMVCVFDLSTAAVVRAVQLPHQVTALAVLRAPPSPDVCQPLQEMGVLAAVGTHAGFVLLLDLCLDGLVDTTERAPGVPTYVTVLEPAVAQRREEQTALGNHLCLPLNDHAVEEGQYRHCTARGRPEHAQSADDTWVSAVNYVPQLRSLVVGLSFGCFQVWNLETLQMEFASRYEPKQLPVVGCVFLEPENDPRRFVYLWLLNSVPAHHDMNDSVASAALYALLYTEREWEQGAPVYRGLEQAGMKLVYDLTTTPEQPDAGRVSASCLLSALPLPAIVPDASGGGDDSLVPRDATSCAIVWEAWTEDGASACTCLALFDLNRWYQAHMPHRVDAAALERCEYLRFFSLDAREGIVMGVSVRAGDSRSGLLATTLLLDVGVQALTFCGPQEQLLRTLQAAGGAQLADPLQVYETARRLALVAPGAISPAEQREALLTLALERGFSSLLAACAARWSSGDADPAGCTLRALLDWLWRRAVEVVTQIDATCVPLFDMSGGVLADEDVAALHGLRAQLDGMGHVLDTMATRTANTDGGLGELESKSYVLRVRSLHTAVIMWLCHAGLLPEQGETTGDDSLELAYPGAVLAQWYAERRRQLGRRLLMIDGLAEELGEPLRVSWQEDGDGSYPPRSLLALTRAYLLDGVPDVRKHRLTHYLLMDLSRLVSDVHDDTLKSFPSCFAMSPSLIKLTHAFWHLDHGNVDSALVFLMDPLVQPADLSAWQHRRIVESLLAQDAPRAALQYARARHLPAPHAADLQLHLRVLLDNGLVTEALKYERRHRTLGGDELAGWLLSGCQQRRLLTQLMRQPLDTTLERRFVEFLQENADRECVELLHVFYLQRGRYREAAGLQRRLAAVAPVVPERADFRESLHQLLPTLTHRRDGAPRAGPGRLGAPGARGRPLSAQLHQVPATVRSRATFIQELLEQEGKRPAPPPVAATPFRPRNKRKLIKDDDESGTPRAGQRRPLGSDVRRLLQTPPVRRVARRSDVQVGTPQARTPAAAMTPQSILKVHRYLEASGGGASGEDTPSKQLRFGLLRGRRSLEESRADTTLPPLATLFTPGKTPAPLRRPARDAPSAAPADRSPSPTTAATPVRLASLFTPGKTPRPLAARVGRLPEPRVTLADAWAAAERVPTPEPVSPPRKRQSLASELDDSEFYSFEASPTVANQTVEIFDRERQLRLVDRSWHDESGVAVTMGVDVLQRSRVGDDDASPTVANQTLANQTVEIFDRERQLRLVERSWHDESDVAVTMGGDVMQRSRAGDDDDTVSEERTSPPPSDDEGQRHSTPQQELAALRSPGLAGRVSLSTPTVAGEMTSLRQEVLATSVSADSPRKQLHLVSPSPRRELHRASVTPRTEEPVEAPASPCRKSHDAKSDGEELQDVSDGARREVHTEIHTELSTVSVVISSASAAESAKPSEDDERRVSGSSGEFSPLIGNKFTSLTSAMTEGLSRENSLDALEAQVLTETSDVRMERTETRLEETPEETRERQAVEEPVVVKRTAWVTGEESEEQDRSLSALEAQVLTVTSVVHTERSETRHEESVVVEESSGEEPVVVKQTAWVTGEEVEEDREQDGDEPEGGLASLEAQVLAGTSVIHTKKTETRREESVVEESPGEEPVVTKRVAWLTGEDENQEEEDEPAVEDTSPLSSSYLAPPSGMQEALQRIGRALDIPEWSVMDVPRSSLTSSGTGLVSSGSEVADSRIEPIELRLESDSEEEEKEEQELFEGFTSLQARPGQQVSPSPPSSPAGGRLSRSSVLRQASPVVGTPLLTPRSSLRRRAGTAAVTETTEAVSIAVVEEATATNVTEEMTATSVTEVTATSVTEEVTATSVTEEVTATNVTEEVTATSVTDVTATNVTEEVTATSVTEEVTATSVTEEVTATSVTEEVTATSVTEEVTATSVTEEVTATSVTEEVTATGVEVTATSVTTTVVERTVVAGVGGSEEVEALIDMAEAVEPESSSPQSPEAEQDLAAVKTQSRTPSPKKDERTATPSPKRSPRMTTPSPKRSPRVVTPSPKRSPRMATPSPKRSPHHKSVPVAESSPAAMVSPKGSPSRTPSTKKTQSATVSSPEKTPSSVQPDSRALEAHSAEHASPVAEIASPSTSPEEESTEPPSSPEAKIATPSAPVAKIITPTSSPPTRASVRAEAARVDPVTLSPLAEEQPSEVPSSPPADTAATLPATPSSVRRSGRRSLTGTTTPRSRLSLLAAVDPLSPVPEGQSVGAAAGDSVETAAAEELEPTEVEDPASTRKRMRRSVSTEPEPAPTSTSKRSRSRAGSVGPATPVRRSMRTRSESLEPEEPRDLATATDDGDTRRRSLRGVSVERDVLATAGTPARSLKSRQASEEPEKAPDAMAKGRRTRKASEEPEEPVALETTATRRRTRKTSETKSTDDSVSLNTTQKGRKTRKASEEPEDQSKLDTTVKTRRARKASEEPEEPSVVDTARKTRRTRKVSEEPEEPSVLETTHTTRRTRKASEEPEDQSVVTARKPRRARKVSEEPEEPSIPERTRTIRTRKTSEPPEVETYVQPSTSKRTRKSWASESSEGASSPEPAAKSRRYRRRAADDTATSPARNTRARSLSVQPESPARLPTRAASEQPAEVRSPAATSAARKRRPVPAAAAEPSTPAAVPPAKRGRTPGSKKKGKTPAAAAAAAAGEEEATKPDAADERSPSPPLKRRVARRSSQAGARRSSQLPAITESASEAMPPPAPTTAAGRRRRRRTTRPALEEEEAEAGSPVVLLTEEQLESLRQRENASPEPVSRDRRTSIARTRQRTGGRRSVRLW